MFRFAFQCLFIISLFSCKDSSSTEDKSGKKAPAEIKIETNLYAKGFSVSQKEGYKELLVYKPHDKESLLCRYALVPRGAKIPKNLPPKTVCIRVPVKSIALFSNIHVGALINLGVEDKIIGITRGNSLFDSSLYKRVLSGDITNLGESHNHNIDIEKVIEIQPELILLSTTNSTRIGEEVFVESGLKLAYACSWMEETALGRTEWIKFIALFFNKEALADSIFKEVETNYNSLKKLATNIKGKPNVMLGYCTKGIWQMPGGHFYMVRYLRDAGANYILNEDKSHGYVPVNEEVVLDRWINADTWIYPGPFKNMREVENGREIYKQFKPFKTGEVYNIYNRTSANGGVDWWETGSTRPDIILKDFIKILHPEILPNYKLYYLSKLH